MKFRYPAPRDYLDKVGSIGSILAAAACPACFPQLAALGALVGLGALSAYEGQIFLATKVLVALAIAGHVLAYRDHRSMVLLVAGAGGGILFFAGMYLLSSEGVVYLGLLAMLVASVVDSIRRLPTLRELRPRAARMNTSSQPNLESKIACPKCGFKRVESMPTDACQFFYECTSCKALLRPKTGDCCVFCSYGSVRCLSKQLP